LGIASSLVAIVILAGCSSARPSSVGGATTPAGTPTPPAVPVMTYAGCPAPGAAIDVCNATFDIPAWGPGPADPDCPQTAVKMTNGLYPSAQGNPNDGLRKFLTADVDHDGRADAIVLLSCQFGDPPVDQLMVVAQTAGGSLRTLGQVVGPTHGDILFVDDVTADADGSIRALVVDRHGSVGGDQALRQWRTYAWDGQQFSQTAGSTSFDAAPGAAKLSVNATVAVFAAPQGGQRQAQFTVTVTNTGTTVAKAVSAQLLIDISSGITLVSSQCPTGALVRVPTCDAGDLAPGASRNFSVTLSIGVDELDMFQSNVPDGSPGVARLMLGDQQVNQTPLPGAKV
jgi:uncharacterized repeat protein (TIGR01451 family)